MRQRFAVAAMLGVLAVACSIPARAQVVALGASNTAGKGLSSAEAYPAQLEQMLRARGRAVSVVNAGANGQDTGGMLARLDATVPEGTRVVILQPGTNDRAAGDRAYNVQAITGRLRARGVKVILFRPGTMKLAADLRQADGVHFTAEGCRVVASQLLPQVLAALGR